MTTQNAKAPFMADGETRAHLTFNEALLRLDFMTCPTLVARATNDPPSTPTNGQAWEIGTGTGAWAGKNGQLALWHDGWRFFPKPEGIIVFDVSQGGWFGWNSGQWDELSIVV